MMEKFIKRKLPDVKNEDGAVAVIAAVAFMAMLIMSGVVIDLGRVHTEISKLQATADASAYAASLLLPVATSDTEKISQIESKAAEYIIKNERKAEILDSVSLSGNVSDQYTVLTVTLKTDVNYLFGQILGIDSREVVIAATAGAEAITAASNTVPLGISKDNLIATLAENGAQDVILKYGAGDGDQGTYGALNLSGTHGGGASQYATWLAEGYPDIIKAGTFLYDETGNMVGPTTAFTVRFDSCTHFPGQGGCTTEHFHADCKRVINLIVFERVEPKKIKVLGFRPFILTGLSDSSEITASAVDVTMATGETAPIDGTNIHYGLFRNRLIG